MIIGILYTPLLVREYQEAIDFYCGILGFNLVENSKQEKKRWVRLQAPGLKGSDLLLSRATNEKQLAAIGNQTGGRVLFFLHTDDFENDLENKKKNNVEIDEGPQNHEYSVVFKDLYGNRIDLIGPNVDLRKSN